MNTLSAAQILQVWERGWDRPPAVAAQLLLSAAFSDAPASALRDLTLGQRDALLLALRERLFGAQMESVANCPACDERLELSFQVNDVRQSSALYAGSLPPAPDPVSLERNGYLVTFRLPTAADLLSAPSAQALLESCLISVENHGLALSAGELPEDVLETIETRMEAADPQAEVRLELECPGCGHHWIASFDIASFLWSEIHTWAQRTLLEIHALAHAYSWSEAEILAMSPLRRGIYLNLVGAAA